MKKPCFGNKIQWENPEKTYIDSTIDFLDSDPKMRKEQIVRLISISKIEEFARLADGELDNLAPYGFMERIPVGFYGFHLDGSRYDVMVFEHLQVAYQDFVAALPTIEAFKDIAEANDGIIDCITDMIREKYFAGKEDFGFNRIDIERIVRYYAESEQQPIFYDFEDRSEFDLDKKVKAFYDEGKKDPFDIHEELWRGSDRWTLIFGEKENNGKHKFYHYVAHLAYRIRIGSNTNNDRPTIQYTQKTPEDCTMAEMKVHFPEHHKQLVADVWAKSKYKDVPGNERFLYEIDHIVEMNNKGKSILENLQVLTKEEHRIKTQSKNAADRLG